MTKKNSKTPSSMEEDNKIIMPTLLSKYPGCIRNKKKKRSRKCYQALYNNNNNTDEESQTKKKRKLCASFEEYEDALDFIMTQAALDPKCRIKNIIHNMDTHYECELTQGERLLFDEVDMPLVQAHVWCIQPSGHTRTCKKPQLPSTLFHLCVMNDELGHGDEVIHLNGKKNDSRRHNMKIIPHHSRYSNKSL